MIMTHKASVKKTNEIEWGFDLTDTKSDHDFLLLLGKYGFKKVKSFKPTDDVYRTGHPINWGFGDRFAEFHVTFANPAGIRITVEHMGGKGDENGALGYIGIRAPKSADGQLQKFLKEFRGKKKVMGTDVMTKGGITTYVKQEDAYVSNYIAEK